MKIKNVNSTGQVVQIKTLNIHVTACFSSAVSDQQRASARVTPRIISDEDPGEPRGGGLGWAGWAGLGWAGLLGWAMAF